MKCSSCGNPLLAAGIFPGGAPACIECTFMLGAAYVYSFRRYCAKFPLRAEEIAS